MDCWFQVGCDVGVLLCAFVCKWGLPKQFIISPAAPTTSQLADQHTDKICLEEYTVFLHGMMEKMTIIDKESKIRRSCDCSPLTYEQQSFSNAA